MKVQIAYAVLCSVLISIPNHGSFSLNTNNGWYQIIGNNFGKLIMN